MLAGIVTLVKASQSEKTKESKVETPSWIVRSVKPEQLANALFLIVLTVLGISTLVNLS